MRKLLPFILICLVLLSCKLKRVDASESSVEKYVVHYGDQPVNEMVIYAKKDTKLRPLLIFVHGGGWSQFNYNTFVKQQLINWSTNKGYVFSAINYSLSPTPFQLDNPNRIKHPAHISDFAKSVKWIYDNSKKYGVDRNRIYIMGHSAGAQMVCLLGTNEKYLKQVDLDLKNIKGVISLDGGAYLTNEPKLMFPADDDASVSSYFKELKRCYYNTFTSDPEVYNDACPYLFIGKDKSIPPFLYICQQHEEYRSRPNGMMYDKMIENQIDASLYLAPINDHMLILNIVGANNDTSGITQKIEQFLASH